MKLVIQTVDPETRTWESPNGPIEFIKGQFTDGSGWSLGCKFENIAERMKTLEDLIGVEGEYEVEAKPEYNGVPQWKLKSWPGKPSFGGGGGSKKEYVPRYQDTQEGFAVQQRSIQRSVALTQAVTFYGGEARPFPPDHVLQLATRFYAWLSLAPAAASGSAGVPIAQDGGLIPSSPAAAGANQSEGVGVMGKDPAPSDTFPEVHEDEWLLLKAGSVPETLLACQHETWEDVPNRPAMLRCMGCGIGKKRVAP